MELESFCKSFYPTSILGKLLFFLHTEKYSLSLLPTLLTGTITFHILKNELFCSFFFFFLNHSLSHKYSKTPKSESQKRNNTVRWLFAIPRAMINGSYLGRRKKESTLIASFKLLLGLLHSVFECIFPLFIRLQCQNSHLTLLDSLGNVIKTDPSATTRPSPTNQ